MESIELTTYMANLDCGSIFVTLNESGISVSGNEVEAKIIPISSGNNYPGQIVCSMIQNGQDPYIDVPIDAAALDIIPDPKNADQYQIIFNNPVVNVDKWIRTKVLIYQTATTAGRQFESEIRRTSGTGSIPEEKKDVILPDGPFLKTLWQNDIVPGEFVAVKWDFLDGNNVVHSYENKKSGKYFKTNYLTSGVIKAFYGSTYEDFDLLFIVTIENADVICRPSDFTRWEVGDFVFIAKVHNEFIILPIQINGKGS